MLSERHLLYLFGSIPYIMPLDHCKCYALTYINVEKVKDAWVKDKRKIDGYREKKIQRNS